jgi:hypothetical protein
MTNDKIDIEKSKETDRVCIRISIIEYIINIFFYSAFLAAFPFISTMYFYNEVAKDNYILSLSFIIVSYTSVIFLIFSLANNRNLKRIFGNTRIANHQKCTKVLRELDWKINVNKTDFIIANKGYDLASTDWGKQMVIIFDDQEILVNSIAFGRYSTTSPFHWFANRKRENKFIQKFLENNNR